MLLRDFKIYFLGVCLFLILLYIFIFPYLWGYEDGTDKSDRALFCIFIFDKVFFSYDFWIKTKLSGYSIILSFFTSTFSITILLSLIIQLRNTIQHLNIICNAKPL